MGINRKLIPVVALSVLLLASICYVGAGCAKSQDPLEEATDTVEQVEQQAGGAAREANLRTIDAAIQNYYYTEGKLPTMINDLIPQYLKEMPTDPAGGNYCIVVQGDEAKAAVR